MAGQFMVQLLKIMAAKRRRIEPVLWTRDDIVCCNCSELKSRHVHCPCSHCNGAAVARSMEYSHWQHQQQEIADLVLTRVEEPSDPLNDSGIDEFTSPSPFYDIVTGNGQDSLCDTGNDHCSDLSENHTSTLTLSSRSCSPASVESTCNTSDTDTEIDPDEIEITIAILKALNLVDQMNGSISDFEYVLQFAKELYCRNDSDLEEKWPRNWQETQSVLKTCGYKAPRELYICLDDSLYSKWDVMEDAEGKCRHRGKEGTIKYYYLGISDKIQLWCANHTMCKKMMAHWDERDHWIEGEGANFTLKEIWDGERFNELSWFWNPESHWMPPVKCQYCANVISVDEIKAFPKEEDRHIIARPETQRL